MDIVNKVVDQGKQIFNQIIQDNGVDNVKKNLIGNVKDKIEDIANNGSQQVLDATQNFIVDNNLEAVMKLFFDLFSIVIG